MEIVDVMDLKVDSKAFDALRSIIDDFSIIKVSNGVEKLLNEVKTFNNLTHFQLVELNIVKLDEEMLKNFPKLKKLDLVYCNISGNNFDFT